MKKDFIIFISTEAALFDQSAKVRNFSYKDFISYLSTGDNYFSRKRITPEYFFENVFDKDSVANLKKFVEKVKEYNYVPRFVVITKTTAQYATAQSLTEFFKASGLDFVELHESFPFCKSRTQAMEVNLVNWWLRDNYVSENFIVIGDYGFYTGMVDTLDKEPKENAYMNQQFLSNSYTVLCKKGFSDDCLEKANILLDKQKLGDTND